MSVRLDAGEAHVEVCYMDDKVMFRTVGRALARQGSKTHVLMRGQHSPVHNL
jgi:hypothetical protein